MKVLIYPEFSPYGGTRTFLEALIDFHSKQGIESAIILEIEQLSWFEPDFFYKRNIRTFIVPKRSKFFFKAWFSLLFDLRQTLPAALIFRPDILIVSNGSPGLMLGSLMLWMPTIFFFHTYPLRPLNYGQQFYITKLLSNSVRIITVSKASAKIVSEFLKYSQDKIRIIYNSFKVPATKVVAGQTKNLILTLGHIAYYKNPKIWLEVASTVISKSPKARFLWSGDGPLSEYIKKEILKRGLSEQIIIQDFIVNIEDLFSSTLIYFQPSIHESHGISIVDAMARGIPCVGSRVGGIPESIEEGQTGFLFNHDDIEGFSGCILRLIDDSELRSKLGDYGKEKANLMFSNEKWRTQIKSLYDEF